jgi:hypothetical protein
MTPESRKAFNTFMGVLLIILAIGCFALAGYMIIVPAKEKTAPPPTIATVSKQSCIEGLTTLGFNAASIGSDIRVTDRNAEANPLDRLKNASLGVSMCHLYLKSFCMGPSCPDPTAMSFTLTPDDPTTAKALGVQSNTTNTKGPATVAKTSGAPVKNDAQSPPAQ